MAGSLIRIITILGDFSSRKVLRTSDGRFLNDTMIFRVSFSGITSSASCVNCVAIGTSAKTITPLTGTFDLPFFTCISSSPVWQTAAAAAQWNSYLGTGCSGVPQTVFNVFPNVTLGAVDNSSTGKIEAPGFFLAYFDACTLLSGSGGSLVVNNQYTTQDGCNGSTAGRAGGGGTATITLVCP